jgi:hypothetical protein
MVGPLFEERPVWRIDFAIHQPLSSMTHFAKESVPEAVMLVNDLHA